METFLQVLEARNSANNTSKKPKKPPKHTPPLTFKQKVGKVSLHYAGKAVDSAFPGLRKALKPFKTFFEESYLQYHKSLNKKLFEGETLRPEVRNILLKIADAWIKYVHILPVNSITDIIFTGGNAQFNYTRFSDIDVHIVYDPAKTDLSEEILEDILSDKKSLWTMKRHNRVKGYSVELYAQSSSDELAASGVYSLKSNSWIIKPIHGNYNFKHDDALNKKVQEVTDNINSMIENHVSEKDFDIMKEKLRDMRKAALSSGGEFSFENCLFKSLRNNGILAKMNNYIERLKDKEFSLE